MRDWLEWKKGAEIVAGVIALGALTANRYGELGNYRRARELTMLLTVEVPAAHEAAKISRRPLKGDRLEADLPDQRENHVRKRE